jgi:hypothetical protein
MTNPARRPPKLAPLSLIKDMAQTVQQQTKSLKDHTNIVRNIVTGLLCIKTSRPSLSPCKGEIKDKNALLVAGILR